MGCRETQNGIAKGFRLQRVANPIVNLRIPCLAITLLIGPLGMKPSGQAALREVIVSHTDEKGILQLYRMKENGTESRQLTFSKREPHAKLLARRKKIWPCRTDRPWFGHPYFGSRRAKRPHLGKGRHEPDPLLVP